MATRKRARSGPQGGGGGGPIGGGHASVTMWRKIAAELRKLADLFDDLATTPIGGGGGGPIGGKKK
jgi:hypothetical protein